jgi:ferrous iron transport protein B
MVNAPDWVIALISNGVGTALQTVGTFLPPVGFMFLCLSILEDSGYMARAAFVMDRFMRWIGLPGKSFVPMLVGFGCSVPAIMATRTLESKRDRFLTVFMTPFMSCGAKLPIWVLFAAAFFPQNPGKLVFFIYITGIVLGIVTGLILKHTLFQGEPTHFIMELPPYHLPRARHIFLHTWERLKIFIWRAGKFIVPMVLVLGILNTVGTDGSIGNEDKKESLLSVVGKSITPIFEPIGVEKDNWPASVSIFTGLFAKESVIGTMKGLYGQDDAGVAEAEDEEYSLVGGLKEAFVSIPENLSGVWSGLIDPLGFAGAEEEAHDGSEDENKSTIDSLKRHFPKGVHQMYSFLLFILLYVPCIAATGVVFREIGKLYGSIFVGYLTLLGWSVATIYHAVMVSHSGLWLVVGTSILLAMFGAFWLYGKKHRVDMI